MKRTRPASVAMAGLMALTAVFAAGPLHAQQQQQTGLQPYYRTTNPNGQAPPTGWTPMPATGVPNVTLPAGGSVWIGAVNSENPDNSKTFQALIYVGLGVTGSTSCDVKGMKGDGTASSTSNKDCKPYYYWWNVKATFTPQPAWEFIRIKNTSNQPLTIATLRVDRMSAWCKKTERSGGSENGPQPRITFGDASFGAQGAMFNNTRITEMEIFPRNTAIDPGEAPSFSAPPETGNWIQEFVAVDPDGEPRPLGGVRFLTDGFGLEAGQEFDMALSMIERADTAYDLFAFDADAGAYQRIFIDDGGTPWWEDFDDDPADIGLHGRRGWKGWDDDPAFDAPVTEAQSQSPLNSVEIAGDSDLVRTFDGATDGRWSFSAWQYIPSGYQSGGSGQLKGSHFLLLNTYQDGGPYNWSVGLQAHSPTGMMRIYHGEGFDSIQIPYETDRWVKIEAVIDLDNDWTRVYYDDNLVTEYPWTGGILGEGGGALDIAAVDLWANNSTPIYYDDLSLVRVEPSSCAADIIDAEVTYGDNEGPVDPTLLHFDDDLRAAATSRVFLSASEPNLAVLRLSGNFACEGGGASAMSLLVQDHASQPNVTARVRIVPAGGGSPVEVAQYAVTFNADADHEIIVPDASQFIDVAGNVVIDLRYSTSALLSPLGFASRTDLVSISLE